MKPEELKKWREENFLSQEDVARAIGVSRATIGAWEQGSHKPQQGNLWQLATLRDFMEQLPRYAQSLGVSQVEAWQHLMQENFPSHTMSAWLKIGGDGPPAPMSMLSERRRRAKELRELGTKLHGLADWLEHGLVKEHYLPDGYGY